LTSAREAKLLKIRKTSRSQALAPQGPRKGEEEHTHGHTLKAYVEEDQTGSRFTYAEKEGVEGGKERRNGGREIGGSGKMGRSRVGGKGKVDPNKSALTNFEAANYAHFFLSGARSAHSTSACSRCHMHAMCLPEVCALSVQGSRTHL